MLSAKLAAYVAAHRALDVGDTASAASEIDESVDVNDPTQPADGGCSSTALVSGLAAPVLSMARTPWSSTRWMAESLASLASVPQEHLMVQGLAHQRIDLQRVSPGDMVCVHLPRFVKTTNQLAIALAQRWRAGRLKRIPCDPTLRGSVNVTHTCIVLAVDAENGRIVVAEASGKRGVCQAVWDFADPNSKDSHVALGANYLIYRLADAEAAGRLGQVAAAWTSAGGAYDRRSAAWAPWRRNSLGPTGQRSLCRLAARSGDEPLRDRLGRPHAMFCSQFVARVWGHVTVSPVLQKENLLGRSNKAARATAASLFKVSPNTVLPSSLHRELLKDSQVMVVGYFTDAVGLPVPGGARGSGL